MTDLPDSPALTIAIEYGDSDARVVVAGEVDAATAVQLETALNEVIDRRVGVAVDLGSVGFIDSSGLRALIVARQRAQDLGIAFRVVATTNAVDRLFELTGLAESFQS